MVMLASDLAAICGTITRQRSAEDLGTLSRGATHALQGLVQEMLRLLARLGSVIPRPEARKLGEERLHMVNVEGIVNLLDVLLVLAGRGVV